MLSPMAEALGPEPIRTAVEAVSKGPVLDAVNTDFPWRFPHPDGRVTQAELWVLRTSGQLWIAAVDGDDVFAMATGDAGAVGVTRGWARDQLRIDGRTVALTRKATEGVEAMIPAFKADAGGPSYPAPGPAISKSPVVSGAVGLVDWWADSVPGESDDPWLLGCTMASEWTFNIEGGVRTAPLVLGIRGRGLAVAARADAQLYTAAVEGPLSTSTSLGRTSITIGGYKLDGALLDGGRTAFAARIAAADEGGRWALVASAAMDDGRVSEAEGMWREALARGFRPAVALDLAVVALAVDRPAEAVTLLGEVHEPSGWMGRLPAWRRVADRARSAFEALIDEHVRAAQAPGPGWPWPPASPAEAWAAAGGPATLPDPPGDPRRLQVEAAITEAKEPPAVAAAAYRVAARAWAGAGRSEDAYRTLQSALRLEPESPDHFQAAVWAYAAGHEAQAAAHVRSGLKVSPAAESLIALDPAPSVLTAVATIAHAEGHAQTAARLLIRALESGAASRDDRLALAEKVADEFRAPGEAAALMAAVAEQAEAEAEDGLDTLWLQVSQLRQKAGDQDGAAEAMRRAVEAAFLRAAVYRRAATSDVVAADTAQWWHHIASLLSGESPPGRPRPRVEHLRKGQLDRLHPGGADWLQGVKGWLDAPAPPARDQLTRGLERLESTSFGEAFAAINDVSRRLEIMPPVSYVYRGDDAYGMSAWPVSPPLILVGHQHLIDGPRHLSGDALTFAVAVELVHLAAEHPVLSFETSLVGTSTSAYQTFGRYAGTAETVVDLVTLVPGIDQLAKLQRIVRLSKRVLTGWNTVNKASNLASPMLRWVGGGDTPETGGIGRERLEGTALQFRIQADRAALLLCGNLQAAVEAVLKTSRRGVVKLDSVARDGLAPPAQRRQRCLGPGRGGPVVRAHIVVGGTRRVERR